MNFRSLSLFLPAAVSALALILALKQPEQQMPETDIIGLGRRLFFEKALSLDSSLSCASCHIPEFAFADTLAFSRGVGARMGLRNTPSVMNVASRERMFYDGRAKDIEDQVHFPVEDPNEMALNYDEAVRRLNADPVYTALFEAVFARKPDRSNLAMAIAAFEKSLETSNTPFDDYMSDIPNSLSASAIRGRELFLSDKTGCFDCHFGPDFTGDEFKNIGLYDGVLRKDQGRFRISGDSSDMGRFKVPGLRNVGVTAPYMHDGSFKTLEQVLEYYVNPKAFVKNPINMDTSMQRSLSLSVQDKEDLLAFLRSLTDRQFLNR